MVYKEGQRTINLRITTKERLGRLIKNYGVDNPSFDDAINLLIDLFYQSYKEEEKQPQQEEIKFFGVEG